MAESTFRLVSFDNPPVVETVLSVQFLPLSKFLVTHFGLYWANIRDKYPDVEIQPTLDSKSETFGKESREFPPVGIRFHNMPEIRCWYIDTAKTHLIQVQKDRFIVNWRKVEGDEVYPRYESFRPRFIEAWKLFCKFLEEEHIDAPEVNQCEVTYVNHFEFGREWKSVTDLPNVFTNWRHTSGPFLGDPELVRFNSRYVIPGEKGRFHVLLQPAFRNRDAKQILQLNLTARGQPEGPDLDGILKFFDLGHEWIVKGFLDLTTPEMHKLWRRTS